MTNALRMVAIKSKQLIIIATVCTVAACFVMPVTAQLLPLTSLTPEQQKEIISENLPPTPTPQLLPLTSLTPEQQKEIISENLPKATSPAPSVVTPSPTKTTPSANPSGDNAGSGNNAGNANNAGASNDPIAALTESASGNLFGINTVAIIGFLAVIVLLIVVIAVLAVKRREK
jgi:hypothetical protein